MSTKVVLVTGCSTGGIGFALAEEFANRGCKVYATSRKVDTVRGFKNHGIKTAALDVTSDDDVQRVVRDILDAEGKIDVVVNNAGALGAGPLIDNDMDRVWQSFNTNTFASLRVAKAVIPEMAKRKSGLIINVGSVVGETPTPWNGLYSAAKAALHSLTEVLYMECKPFNIDVMLLIPGAVKSNLSKNQANIFTLSPNSLYTRYLDNIVSRIHASQGSHAMPTEEFARRAVAKALSSSPPSHVTLGGGTLFFSVLKWVPRAWVLWLMWKIHSKRKT